MKVIIAGSREGFTLRDVEEAVKDSDFDITHVISGGARGVDSLGNQYAVDNSLRLTIKPAEWETYGKSAGYRRNVEMADIADALIVLIKDGSKGSTHMKEIATKKGLPIYEVNI